LILFSWTVVVDRVRAMNEYPKSHSFSARPFRKSILVLAANSPKIKLWAPNSRQHLALHSHSIVPGGFDVTS
jgi:hypothetical protein